MGKEVDIDCQYLADAPAWSTVQYTRCRTPDRLASRYRLIDVRSRDGEAKPGHEARVARGALEAVPRPPLGFVKVHLLYHASQEPIYGSGISAELERHGYRLSPGTLYPVLHSLDDANFLVREDRAVGEGAEVLRTTPLGEQALDEARGKIRELVDEIMDDARTPGQGRRQEWREARTTPSPPPLRNPASAPPRAPRRDHALTDQLASIGWMRHRVDPPRSSPASRDPRRPDGALAVPRQSGPTPQGGAGRPERSPSAAGLTGPSRHIIGCRYRANMPTAAAPERQERKWTRRRSRPTRTS